MPYYIWYLQVIMEEQIRSVEQLVIDEQFLAWYKADNHDATQAWEAKMAVDPYLAELSGEARIFLDRLIMSEKGLDAEKIAAANQQFQEILQNKQPAPVRRLFLRWAAAAILLLGIGTATWWFTQNSEINYVEQVAGFGETRELLLPDGSHIQLNANTKLKYPANFENSNREVWIEGEAFLEVVKTGDGKSFVVHTDLYDITVKGTKFNVLARENRQQVLLTEGAIDLSVKGGATESLRPGDWMIVKENSLEKRRSDGKAALAWMDKQMIFEKSALSEVAQRIREYYGLEVNVDQGLEEKAVSGIFPNNDLNILLETLSASGEFGLLRNGSALRFTRK